MIHGLHSNLGAPLSFPEVEAGVCSAPRYRARSHVITRCSDVQPVASQTPPNCCRYEDEPDEPSDGADSADVAWWEEERASLQHSLRALQTQFASERARREELQREAELLTGENAALEQQVSGMEACRVGGTCIYGDLDGR